MLMQNGPFVYLTLAISTLYFAISGIQYWATYYFEHALGIEPEWANIYFGVVALTSPVLGAIAGGIIISWFGGYYSPFALPFCCIIGAVAIFSGWLVPHVYDYHVTIVLMWILLFVGAIVLPICTGVCFTKVEPELRPAAQSIANLSYNLLGYFPAPMVYGFVEWLHNKEDSGWGMGAIMYTITFMFPFIVRAMLTDPTFDRANMWKFKRPENTNAKEDDRTAKK